MCVCAAASISRSVLHECSYLFLTSCVPLFCSLLSQGSVRANQKGDEGQSRQGGEHGADAELPAGSGHPAAV